MSEPIDPEIVRIWLQRLRSGTEREKERAASELSRMQIRTRGAVRTRGGLSRAARNEFADKTGPGDLQTVIQALQDESPAVRREVAFSLGEWGDEEAAESLSELVRVDPDEQVRRAAVAALGVIGGPIAVDTLCQVVERDQSESLRSDALSAITQMAISTRADSTISTSGTVRTRGTLVRPRTDLGGEGRRVLAALQRLRDDTTQPEHLRRMAEVALESVVE
jgi:hypothetical protein